MIQLPKFKKRVGPSGETILRTSNKGCILILDGISVSLID